MSEAEFVDWCTPDTWAEWIDGEVLVMSPVGLEHADLFGFLFHLLRAFVDDNELGKVLSEPFQVRLSRLRRRRAPDILFVSNARLGQLTALHVEGAPDLIVEVISPDSQSRDRRDKYLEYQQAGVREYWIVDPLSHSVEAYSLNKSKNYQLIEEDGGVIRSTVLPKFYLKPAWLWRAKLPKVSELLREMTSKR
jgi:Uma2 family endonuclease